MPHAVCVKRDLAFRDGDGLGGSWRELLAVNTCLDSRVEPWNDDDIGFGCIGQGRGKLVLLGVNCLRFLRPWNDDDLRLGWVGHGCVGLGGF